jgi:hypothetical protein
MPKSRNRKQHKAKAAAFKKRVEDRRRSFDKQMRMLYEQQQQEALDRQMKGEVQSVESEGAGIEVGDFNMDEIPQTPDLNIPSTIEGVTKLGTSGD